MKYELPSKRSGYLPEVISFLETLDDQYVFSENHELSHPSDIFMLTFRDAIECISRLSKSVDDATQSIALDKNLTNERLSEIRHEIFDLLFYSANFVEGCLSIIKSLFPKGDKRFNKAVREFRNNVEEYVSHASTLINRVKHRHRRPRVFTFIFDKKIIIGYYLEGVVEKGVLGPDLELHKSYRGMLTGFSLNRAIPYHLCNLYYVSACLAHTVKEYGRFSTNNDGVDVKSVESKWLCEALTKAANIPCLLLPDEFEKPLPVVILKNDSRYILELPGRKEILNRRLHDAQVNLETRVGVRDRGIALPYKQRDIR